MVRAGGGGGGGSPPRWAPVTIGNHAISNSAGSVVARRHRCRRGVNASVRCRMANLLALGLFNSQVAVYRFDELRRGPRSRRRAVAAVIIERRPRRLHLLERRSFLHQILNPIANDR